MHDNRKLRDVFNIDFDNPIEMIYPLQIWYANLLEKNHNELTIQDIMKMMRQNIFIEMAVEKAIEFLKNDSMCFDLYEGDVLETLCNINDTVLKNYYSDIKQIIFNAKVQNEHYEWLCEFERNDFDIMLRSLEKNLTSNILNV